MTNDEERLKYFKENKDTIIENYRKMDINVVLNTYIDYCKYDLNSTDIEIIKSDLKGRLLEYYQKCENEEELQQAIDCINNSNITSKEIDELKNEINNKLNKDNDFKETFEKIKEENSSLNNFKIITTTKEINSKNKYDQKKDIYYIKASIEGNDILYEIEPNNELVIENILSDSKDLNELEILENIKPYIKPLQKINMDFDKILDKETIKNELNIIYDNEIKEVFLRDIENVLKERIKIQNYVKDLGLINEKLDYNLNSSGERIYIVGEKIIKFDEEGRMHELNENDNELVNDQKIENSNQNENINNNNFENDNINQNIENELPKTIQEMDNDYYKNILTNIDNKIQVKIDLTDNEILLFETFIELCANEKKYIPEELNDIYNKYYEAAKDNDYYYDEKIEEILKPLIDKEKQQELNKDNSLILKKDGFVNITLMVCGIILIILLILYLVLIK